MIPIKTTVHRNDYGLSKRDWTPLLRAGYHAAAKHWIDKFLPRHFEKEATFRYSHLRDPNTGERLYAPRSESYQRYKRKRYGHNKPLVFTGQAKRAILASAQVKNLGGGGAQAHMKGPAYIQPYRVVSTGPDGGKREQPPLGAEITSITLSESRELTDVIDDTITEEVNKTRPLKRGSLTGSSGTGRSLTAA
jgi:hypothetical protein